MRSPAQLTEGKPLAPALRALLLVALHQLEYSRNPPEVTVSSAVDAARLLQQPRAAGLINALLRRFLRQREALLAPVLADAAAASAHPAWLLRVTARRPGRNTGSRSWRPTTNIRR